jgi:hypothetical protein
MTMASVSFSVSRVVLIVGAALVGQVVSMEVAAAQDKTQTCHSTGGSEPFCYCDNGYFKECYKDTDCLLLYGELCRQT